MLKHNRSLRRTPMNLIQTWNNIRTHLAINYVLELQRVEKKFRRKMLIAYIKSKSKSLRVASINWKTNACYATGIFTRTHHRIQSAYGLVSWWFPSSFDFIATCLHTRRLISCCCTILISFFLWRSLSLSFPLSFSIYVKWSTWPPFLSFFVHRLQYVDCIQP